MWMPSKPNATVMAQKRTIFKHSGDLYDVIADEGLEIRRYKYTFSGSSRRDLSNGISYGPIGAS